MCLLMCAQALAVTLAVWPCKYRLGREVAMWMWVPTTNLMQDRFSADRSESLSYVLCLVFANNSQPTEVSL